MGFFLFIFGYFLFIIELVTCQATLVPRHPTAWGDKRPKAGRKLSLAAQPLCTPPIPLSPPHTQTFPPKVRVLEWPMQPSKYINSATHSRSPHSALYPACIHLLSTTYNLYILPSLNNNSCRFSTSSPSHCILQPTVGWELPVAHRLT